MTGTVFSPCCLTWDQTMVEVMKKMATSFKRSHAHTAALGAPDPAAGHRPMPLPETPGHSRASLGQSLVGSLLLSPGSWFAQSFVCALKESVSPVLCKFWRLCGGVIGDLLQEGLCHTQVCCTQRPCPCGRPLTIHTSAGDIQTLNGRSGSVSVMSHGVHKVLFELSEHLWWVGVWLYTWFHPSNHLSGTSPLPLVVGYLFLVGSNVLLSIVVQKWVVKKMSTCSSIPPSWSGIYLSIYTHSPLYSFPLWFIFTGSISRWFHS